MAINKNIGLFGGTFNPIHMGHLQVAGKVKEEFALDKIYFIPSALPPHKNLWGLADAKDRLEMTRLAVSDCRGFTVSDIELKRSGLSYTIDTVRYFKSIMPEDNRFYLIMGMDAFLEIDTWKSYMDLFALIPFIVMARAGGEYSKGAIEKDALGNYLKTYLRTYLKSKISDKYRSGKRRFNKYGASFSRAGYVHPEKQTVFIFDKTLVNISSTKIRKLVKEKKSIKSLVPETVENYITIKGLYL